MRYTTYHYNVAVIRDKKMLPDALRKLAQYEDVEEDPQVDEVIQGLIREKHDSLSRYSEDRIVKAIRLIIRLANFHASAEEGLIGRYHGQRDSLLKYIDKVDGSVTDDPVALIRERVEAME